MQIAGRGPSCRIRPFDVAGFMPGRGMIGRAGRGFICTHCARLCGFADRGKMPTRSHALPHRPVARSPAGQSGGSVRTSPTAVGCCSSTAGVVLSARAHTSVDTCRGRRRRPCRVGMVGAWLSARCDRAGWCRRSADTPSPPTDRGGRGHRRADRRAGEPTHPRRHAQGHPRRGRAAGEEPDPGISGFGDERGRGA